ncbi:MAG: hypothetical protein V7636_1518 [Actinomycetota bacterium]
MDDARSEADERVGGAFDVRVLEPSPPVRTEAPWFADDPVHEPGPSAGDIVAPVPGLGRSWSDLVAVDPSLAEWCSDRWLAAWRRLPEVPPGYASLRTEHHRLAEEMSAARQAVNGKIGLRYVRGGFGTPFFGDGEQRRVEAPFFGDLLGFGASVLEELRVRWDAIDDTRVQLWAEHFDLSIDCGGNRATYGISPGDDEHPEPYLYVAPWEKQSGPLWADPHFGGAALPYDELLTVDDQRASALEYIERCWRELAR